LDALHVARDAKLGDDEGGGRGREAGRDLGLVNVGPEDLGEPAVEGGKLLLVMLKLVVILVGLVT